MNEGHHEHHEGCEHNHQHDEHCTHDHHQHQHDENCKHEHHHHHQHDENCTHDHHQHQHDENCGHDHHHHHDENCSHDHHEHHEGCGHDHHHGHHHDHGHHHHVQIRPYPNENNNKKRVKCYSPIILAALRNDTNSALKILTTDNVNDRSIDNFTALHFAMMNGNLVLVEKLVEFGARLNKRTITHDGMTPIITAVKEGHFECIKKFLECAKKRLESNGNNLTLESLVSQGNLLGETPLHYVCKLFMVLPNGLEMIKLLVDYGANVNAYAMGTLKETPLLYFARTVPPESVILMMKNVSPHVLRDYKKVTEILQERNGTFEELPAPETPLLIIGPNVPKIIVPPGVPSQLFAHHRDASNRKMEVDFGGAHWSYGCNECFYFGKKPRVGMAVDIHIPFTKTQKGMSATFMQGFIHTINYANPELKSNRYEDLIDLNTGARTSFNAIVSVNPAHYEKLSDIFPGEYDVTVEWNPEHSKHHPWIVTRIFQNTDETKTTVKLSQIADELELENGRSVLPNTKPHRCTVVKGMEQDHASHHHELPPRVVIGVDMFSPYKIVSINYQPDEFAPVEADVQIVDDTSFNNILTQLVQTSAELLRRGQAQLDIKVDGKQLDVLELIKKQFKKQVSTPVATTQPSSTKAITSTQANVDKCANCSKTGTSKAPLKRCSACQKVFYCSSKCQTENWPSHKALCKKK